jgi:signal-transduction protein with cAMP-binding, CBS, and nucleotidyltransferase domain
MDDNRTPWHEEEYLRGLDARQRKGIGEEILERHLCDMKRRPWLAMEVGEKVGTAAREMVSRKIGSVLVTIEGRLAGIVTERDLLNRMVLHPFDPKQTTLGDIMTREVQSLRPHDTIAVAIHRMSVGGCRHVPLGDADHRPVGMVSVRDIVDDLAAHFPHKILTQPPDHTKVPGSREGG